MNIFDDNRATPKKRTGVKNNINSPAKENDNDNNQAQTIAPEIAQPNPSSATPTIPTEMPARDIKWINKAVLYRGVYLVPHTLIGSTDTII